MNRPNIFDYAKKELSQDAMICWLLECCRSGNGAYREIGHDFVRFILDDESIAADEIELDKYSPHAQHYRMDVYANIRVGREVIPVIFEDKTNTFLHGEQERRYIDRVNSWKDNSDWIKELFNNAEIEWSEDTRFVLFKTGYVFAWQKDDIENLKTTANAKVRVVYIEDMLLFIARHKDKDSILADYYAYLSNRIKELPQSRECLCDRYFGKIFGDDGWFEYSYQQWGSRNFAHIAVEPGENWIYYTIRSGWKERKYKENGQQRKEREYYIGFMQYRNESILKGNKDKKEQLTEQRRVITQETKEICERIAEDMGREIATEDNTKNRMPHQNFIFREWINDENEDEVCSFFTEFIKRFNSAAKEKYGEKYFEER